MQKVRRQAPAVARNREPILEILRDVLPGEGLVLEIASGSGEHALHFARALPALIWQPSDPSAEALASIAAWREEEGPSNLLPPLELDASAEAWSIQSADAVVCINMVHFSPWEATVGLMRGAERILTTGAPLVLYGPYKRGDRALEPSNAAFDTDLRLRNARWGLRDLDDVCALAEDHGLERTALIEMPANNLTVVFRRR